MEYNNSDAVQAQYADFYQAVMGLPEWVTQEVKVIDWR